MTDPQFRNDAILWYCTPTWESLGLAVPNFGDDSQTLNENIADLVHSMGRNLQAVMCSTDAMLRTPPSPNTLIKIHKLIVRARDLMSSRSVGEADVQTEAEHVNPAPVAFRVFPTPFFQLRNSWMKMYCQYALWAISEAMQHTENRKAFVITERFSGSVGKFLRMIYTRMSVELLRVPKAEAEAPDFTLTDAHFAAYKPSEWFTSTEMIDTVPSLKFPTEDDLFPLTEGVPVTELPTLKRYPGSANNPTDVGTDAAKETSGSGGQTATGSSSSFFPANGP